MKNIFVKALLLYSIRFAFSQKIEGSSTQAAIEIQCGASPLES
jgi:hypothetical protein